MSASMYIVVQGEDPGFDTFVNGRALVRNEDALERLAIRLGVRPLIDFFSADANSMSLLIEEGAGNPDLLEKLPPPQWFPGDDGLATIRPLLQALRDDQSQLGSESVYLREELEEYEVVLQKTADRGLRWHLAVSWR
ncbi:hypothetical protein [Terriglobus roseus]|uniref:Uncharacterized protein n=1 Tax=Terriglobus roseus TaxID=392734 RepID=A0A1H4IUD6_9BACT|nr:hypothetical protein [Terriglobus roseus]SEB36842.1 hypothetical protein SAMN05443244_0012 [Terriglobus roseus]